jgi:hypothetical protein
MYHWWCRHRSGKDWSEEERWLRKRVFAVGLPVYFMIYVPELYILPRFGIDDLWSARISYVTGFLIGVPISRLLCGLLWPEKVRKAEENAGKRYGNRPVNW